MLKSVDHRAGTFKRLASPLWARTEDGGNSHRSIRLDDILVVAPFNIQVGKLQRMLPDEARVGTVDKFQGQEAPVVISLMPSGVEHIIGRRVGGKPDIQWSFR